MMPFILNPIFKMKLAARALALLTFLTLCLIGCTRPSQPTAQSPKSEKKTVLCTVNMITDLVEQIAQDKVETVTLIKRDLDPHSYELVKGDDEKLIDADLVFYNGLGLEHSPQIYHHLKSHRSSFAIGDYIQTHFPDLILETQGQVDPHIWMDVALWEKGVPLLTEQLCKLAPEHQELFKANSLSLQKKMKETHFEILTLMQKIPSHKRYLITCHDAFYYFTKSYLSEGDEKKSELWRERFIAPEGLAPDCELSTSDLQKVIHFLKKHQITTIFPEYNVNLDSIYKIKEASDKSGLSVEIAPSALYGDTMSQEKRQNQSYLEMVLHNAKVIHQHLSEEGS